jgi:K+ transporter
MQRMKRMTISAYGVVYYYSEASPLIVLQGILPEHQATKHNQQEREA